MSLTNEQKADAQIKLFEKLTSYSLKRKGSAYVKPNLEKIDKKYLKKIARFDELPINSLYFIVESGDWDWLQYWAQYYPSGFKNSKPSGNLWVDGVAKVPNHRWEEMGQKIIKYDFLEEDEDGKIEGWDDGSEFYLFTPPPPLENKPFLNWKQENPFEVKP